MAMFGLFKKKVKPVEKKSPAAGSEELRALAAKFLPEERTILAVTGPSGCTSGKQDGDELYTVGIVLTAWMDDETGVVTPYQQGLLKLAEIFGVTVDYLLGREETSARHVANDESKRIEVSLQEQVLLL